METELILIRHGETDWNREMRFQGQSDIELNEQGREQAAITARYLVDTRISKVYSSDLKRARQTAFLIAKLHQLKPNLLPGLREINYGQWEGLTYNQIREKDPELLDRWYTDPSKVSPPGGESLQNFQQRIIETFENIVASSNGETVAVVGHGGSIRTYLTYILKIPYDLCWRIQLDNLGISRILYYDHTPVLKVTNNTSHLSKTK